MTAVPVMAGLVVAIMLAYTGLAIADPKDVPRPPITHLPVVTPTTSSWAPQYPFPFDKMRNKVTAADITAEREMCQWFQPQYGVLVTQVDTFSSMLGAVAGDYSADGVMVAADIVVANLDQSVAYLAPRAESLTQATDLAGDVYFPIFQGENFYRLWQQLSNVSIGIKSRHSSWDFGPPMRLAEHYGSLINSSRICH